MHSACWMKQPHLRAWLEPTHVFWCPQCHAHIWFKLHLAALKAKSMCALNSAKWCGTSKPTPVWNNCQVTVSVPGQLLHGADIHQAIVQVINKTWHVLHEENLVHVDGVAGEGTFPFLGVLQDKVEHELLSSGEGDDRLTTGIRQARLQGQQGNRHTDMQACRAGLSIAAGAVWMCIHQTKVAITRKGEIQQKVRVLYVCCEWACTCVQKHIHMWVLWRVCVCSRFGCVRLCVHVYACAHTCVHCVVYM